MAVSFVHEMLAQLLVLVPEQVVCVCNNVFLAFAQHYGSKCQVLPAASCEHEAGHACILLPLFLSSSSSSSSSSFSSLVESTWCALLQVLGLLQAVNGAIAWRTNPTLFHAGSSESEQQPEAAQAEAAQGFESAQEDVVAPQPPMTAASTKGQGSGKGRGTGRGLGWGGGRAAARKAAATADEAQGIQHISCMLTESGVSVMQAFVRRDTQSGL